MNMKRWLTGALALLLMLASVSVAAGCTDSGSSKETDKNTDSSGGTESGGETSSIDELPKVNYDGYDFIIGSTNYRGLREVVPEFQDVTDLEAGTIDEAVYTRNQIVEDQLGITISNFHVPEYKKTIETIEKEALSQDGAFEAYSGPLYYMLQASVRNYLYDLNQVSTMDFNRSWWDQELAEYYSLGSDNLYMMGGDINYSDDYGQYIVYFNSSMMKDLNLEIPYDSVRDGSWTMDKFLSYMKGVYKDDGDSAWSEKDTWGLTCNVGMLSMMLNGFGTVLVSCEEPGVPTATDNEKIFDQVAKIMDNIFALGNKDVMVFERETWGYTSPHFLEGRSLFTFGGFDALDWFRRDMEDDFGVLPYPKYDEKQTQYYNVMDMAISTAYSIISTTPNVSRTGEILEYMGKASHDTVYKTAIETNAMIKATRDDDTAEMIELIFDTKIFELGSWPTKMYEATTKIAMSGSNTWTSTMAAVKDAVAAEWADFSTYYTKAA